MPRKPKSPPEVRYTDRAFHAHALALGQLALGWNGLHQTLCVLYCQVMGGKAANQHLAVWNALTSDRTQRQILLAAVKNDFEGARPVGFEDDIKWLCARADVIEEGRNNALYSPLWVFERMGGAKLVMPMIGLGHVRAAKLFDKDLLAEFRWCRDASMLLAGFAAGMAHTLEGMMVAWRDRPVLPPKPPSLPKNAPAG